MTGGSTLRLVVLLLPLLPSVAADALPLTLRLDPEAGFAAVEADLAPPFALPGTQSDDDPPRLVVQVAWRVGWDPQGCDAPSGEAYADLAGHAAIGRTPGASRCDLGTPMPPATSPSTSAPIEFPARDAELPRPPPLDFAHAEFELAPAQTAAWSASGVSKLEVAPTEATAHTQSALLVATPVADARAQMTTTPPRGTDELGERSSASASIVQRALPDAPAILAHADDPAPAARSVLRETPTRDPDASPLPPHRPTSSAEVVGLAAVVGPPPRGDPLFVTIAVASALAIAAALYQRVRRPAALEHPARRALHDACAALGRPATAGELGVATGIARKTAEYHLLYLARLGLLRVDASPEGPRRFAVPTTPPAPQADPLDERLLEVLSRADGRSARELAIALGVSRSSVERRLRDLLLERKVEARKNGARRYYLV